MSDNSLIPEELQPQFKNCAPKLQRYINALHSENSKLCDEIAKLQANNLTLRNRMKSLEAEMEKQVSFKIQGEAHDKSVHKKLNELVEQVKGAKSKPA